MAEQLGEAVLVLRTDDRLYDRGVTEAKAKGQDLGRTLDITSGSATKLTKALNDNGTAAGSAASQMQGYSADVVRLKAAIDPAWGALQKFKQEAQLARQALDEGAITHKQYVEHMRGSAAAAGLLTEAGNRVTAMTGAQRAGTSQLVMNLSDMTTMYSMGARPAQIFASQIGQVTQAIMLMSNGTSKFAAFMQTPWAMAIQVGVMVLGPLIAKILETGDAAETAEKKMLNFANSAGLAEATDRWGKEVQKLGELRSEYNKLAGPSQQSQAFFANTVRGREMRGDINVQEQQVNSLRGMIDMWSPRVDQMSDDKEAKREAKEAERERKRAEAAARKANSAAERQGREDEAYARDLAGLGQDLLQIRQQMAVTIEERYQIERQALDVAIVEQRRRIQDNRDYSEAEKAKLLAQLDIKASLERELIERRKQEEIARQALEVAQALRSNQVDLLQKEARLADTRDQRRAIELRILDLTYEQERAQLDAVLASKESTEAQKKIAEARLAVLGQLKSGDQAAIGREYESPMQRYIRDINGLGRNIDDQMENVAVRGLDTLGDRLTQVILRTKSLGAAFKDVATQIIGELMRIAIQRSIIGPLANALFGGGGMQSGDDFLSSELGGGGGGFFGKIISGIGQATSSYAGGHADGGLIPSGGWGIVGERGPERIMATSAGAQVQPNSSLRGGGGGNYFDLRGAVTTQALIDKMNAISRQAAGAAVSAYDQVVGDRVKNNLSRRG